MSDKGDIQTLQGMDACRTGLKTTVLHKDNASKYKMWFLNDAFIGPKLKIELPTPVKS